jgi:dipeptide/tripeptide permease
MADKPDSPEAREPLFKQIQDLDNRFWIVNTMEMFERLAYYGVRAVVAIYMVLALEAGGPEFNHSQKGAIFAMWAFVQSLLPVFTGGFADRYGHKRTISVAIAIKILGYIVMAYRQDLLGFAFGCFLLAAGTAIFKPGVQGTLAATMKKSSASVGWGLFYQIVNVGGFLGPVVAGYLRLMDWQYVFIACAGIVAVNYLWLPFYVDPTHESNETEEEAAIRWGSLSMAVSTLTAMVWGGLWTAATVVAAVFAWLYSSMAFPQPTMVAIMAGIFMLVFWAYIPMKSSFDEGRTDPLAIFLVSAVGMFQHRVISFCIVFSGFWFMFNQVFDLLPNYIDDWVDSSGIIGSLGAAFSGQAVPAALALFLGVVYGGVCGVGVLLAMRPDRVTPAEIYRPSYAVVGISLTGAIYFLVSMVIPAGESIWSALLPIGVASAVGALFAGGVMASKAPAKPVALVTTLVGAGSAVYYIRNTLIESAPTLVTMAADGAQVPPEWMLNLNPGMIVFTMIGFAYLSSFTRPLISIMIGMVVATLGSAIAGTTTVGWICIAGIMVFSIGEMLSSPKKMEYLATLAKPGQEGLFMGYANVPVAIGWVAGSLIAGDAYERTGDKVNLARRHLVDELNVSPEAVEVLQKTDVMPMLADKLGMSVIDAQNFLFTTYEPQWIWVGIALTGIVSMVGMIIYDRVLKMVAEKE